MLARLLCWCCLTAAMGWAGVCFGQSGSNSAELRAFEHRWSQLRSAGDPREVARLRQEVLLFASTEPSRQVTEQVLSLLLELPIVGPAPKPPTFPISGDAARQYQTAYATWRGLPLTITNSMGLGFQLIPPGTFWMGSPESEPGHNANGYDESRHQVTLTQPFYLSRYETTVGQFRRFVEQAGYTTDGQRNGGGHAHDELAVWKHRPGTSWLRPGYAGPFELTDQHPVVHVSHTDSRAFCQWLQSQSKLPQDARLQYDLPTEAQWEWACRAGSGERYWWGPDEDTTGRVLNTGDQALKRTHPQWPRDAMPMNDEHAFAAPVGTYRANAFGLHDMLGNVWEFCSTRYGPYSRGAAVDPGDLDPMRGFAVRGGGWSNTPTDVRCASRNADPPHFCHSNLGFRVAVKLPARAEANQPGR
jgi:formylglycine-generating enzyme required for sulfatase activity